MKIKYFFLGFGAGVVLTFIALFIIGSVSRGGVAAAMDPVDYLETPVSYEGKAETKVKVFQVIGKAALAHEKETSPWDMEMDDEYGYESYTGNVVMIIGDHYYSDQIVKIKSPMRIGTYSYTSQGGLPLTVPVIDGTIIE